MPLGAHRTALMGVAGVSSGDVVLLNTLTATGDTTLSFTSKITSAYGEYIWKFYNINPATAGGIFSFQVNSGYNQTLTASAFVSRHGESNSMGDVGVVGYDKAQETIYQELAYDPANDADASTVGELHIFNPSSTTFVKHFYAETTGMIRNGSGATAHYFTAGYFNLTGVVDQVQFKCSSGAFDGVIKMWGVKN